ncbi:MAG: response regulator [Saprospiraceae bacterium]|nr:response regulator [Saprospiraceae bacterium]
MLDTKLHLWTHLGFSLPRVAKTSLASLFLCCFLPCAVLLAQVSSVGFEEVPIEVKGEKISSFKDIIQDDVGFLWMNTHKGRLLRYNGYEIKVYEYIPGDSTSLLPGGTEGFYIDHSGSFWIGMSEGVSRYVPDCDCFKHYFFEPNDLTPGGLMSTFAGDFTEDPAQNLWVGQQGGGLYRYDRVNDQFIRYLDDPTAANSIVKDIVRVLLADKNGNIWIGTGYGPPEYGGGLVRFNPSTGEVKRFKHDPLDPNSLLDNRVSALMEDAEGTIWVGTYQCGLHQYRPSTEDFTRMLPDANDPNAIHAPCDEVIGFGDGPFVQILHQDQHGDYWFGTLGVGLNHFNSEAEKLNFISPSEGGFNWAWTLYEDRQGHLWLTYLTGGEGLWKMDLFARKFNFYPALKSVEESAESKVEPGIFWLSTFTDGLHKLNIKTGTTTSFLHNELDKGSLASNAVRTAYEDEEGTIWVGLGTGGIKTVGESGDGGLARLDRQTNQFIHYDIKRDDTTDFSHTVYAISGVQADYLWLAIRHNELVRFDKQNESFKRYAFSESKADSRIFIPDNIKGDALWALDFTHKVLYRYNKRTDNFSPFLRGYQAMAILEEGKDRFWMATFDKGLLYYNHADGSIEQYTVADGLPTNEISNFRKDSDGILWIATLLGLIKFDPVSKQFDRTGLPADPVYRTAFQGNDGQLFFGGNSGLYAFYPDEVKGSPFPPEVRITRLEVSGEPYALTKDAAEKISLSHQQNDFHFEYVGLHYSDPLNNKYQYRLIPYDDKWINGGKQRSARYTNLDPGRYTFQVKAANSDGFWTEKGAVLLFEIHPPWWQTWWAYLGFAFLLAAIFYGWSAYRRRQWLLQHQLQLEQQEAERLKELDQVKTQLYTNITHEFRTPLTVISGMADQVLENPEDWFRKGLTMIKRNSRQLLGLINQMLDLSKLEAGSLPVHLIQDDIVQYLKYLVESMHSYAESKDIRLHLLPGAASLQMDFDPAKIQAIFLNLIGNGIKFTPEGGDIYITVLESQKSEHGSSLELKVKDKGVGIPADQLPHIFDRFYQVDDSSTRKGEGTGIGLALTRELVKLLGGRIEVESQEGEGTEFTVSLPISRIAEIGAALSEPQEVGPRSELIPGELPLAATAIMENPELPFALLIEDNKDVLQYLAACLQGQYRLEKATNGREGIEKALNLVPDIIISDVMMPEKDGFEVVATLKEDMRTSHIPIILLTAKADLDSRLEGLERGADAYLSKPFEKQELEVRLRKLIELRQQLSARYSTLNPSGAPTTKAEAQEDSYLQELKQAILSLLEEGEFTIPYLCRAMGVSRTQLHRKLKALTGKTTSQVIRTVRMHRAKELLQQSELNVSEVGYAIGYDSPSHFSQEFAKEFGQAPSFYKAPKE